MRLFSNKIQENSKIRVFFLRPKFENQCHPPPWRGARGRTEMRMRSQKLILTFFLNENSIQQPRRRRYSPIQTTNDDTENSTNFSKQREQKNGTGPTKKLKMMTDIDPGAACWNLTSQMACAQKLSPISCITHVILPIFVSFPLTGIKSRIHTKLLSQYRLYRGVGDGRGRYWWTSYSLLPPRGS